MKFNTRFNLRKQDSKKPEKVYLICRFDGEKFVYPTAFNVLPKNWNVKAGEIRNVIDEPNRQSINGYLKDMRAAVKSVYESAVIARNPITKEFLKEQLDKWTGKVVEQKITFWNWIDLYISESKKRINPKTGKTVGYRTIMRFESIKKYLIEYEQENRLKLDFVNIDRVTIADFADFLTTGKGFAINTVGKLIDGLRQFLRAAKDENIEINNDALNTKRFSIRKEKAQNIYLSEPELQSIEKLDFSNANGSLSFERLDQDKKQTYKVNYSTLDRVKDLFLIGCYTGLRVSDFNNLKPHNIKNDTIDIYQTKTGERVVIPINNKVKAILTKYGGQAPPKISDQKINLYIKEIAKLADINESVEKQQTKGGERISTVLEKWQYVTSHTARRSFATNMVKKGFSAQFIMRITGHKKESVFWNYVKLSPLEYAEMMKVEMSKNDNLNND